MRSTAKKIDFQALSHLLLERRFTELDDATLFESAANISTFSGDKPPYATVWRVLTGLTGLSPKVNAQLRDTIIAKLDAKGCSPAFKGQILSLYAEITHTEEPSTAKAPFANTIIKNAYNLAAQEVLQAAQEILQKAGFSPEEVAALSDARTAAAAQKYVDIKTSLETNGVRTTVLDKMVNAGDMAALKLALHTLAK